MPSEYSNCSLNISELHVNESYKSNIYADFFKAIKGTGLENEGAFKDWVEENIPLRFRRNFNFF